MDRRTFLEKSTGLASGMVLASSCNADRPETAAVGTAGAETAARNVVMIVVDDQGLDAGCYGNPVIQTPHLDRLARDGTRFDYAFCTTASCSASRSVILSGLYNHANGQFGHMHDFHNFHTHAWVESLPVLLRRAGYRTARVGKYHVQPASVYAFDTRLEGNQGGQRNPITMANLARDWLAQDREQPFFLYFCTSDPHRSGAFLEDQAHRPNAFGNEGTYEGVETITYDPADVIVPPFLPDTPACRAELAQYYQAVSRVDQGLGTLIEALKALGYYDDTLILYLSDNGIAFPGAKTTLYDPGMRLPCIVRNPYLEQQGGLTDAMITWADLTPTILDFTGAASPEGDDLHGRSFLSVLDQRQAQGWDEVYASHTFHEVTMYYPMRVVRTRRHKLLFNIAHGLPYPFATDLYAAPTWRSLVDNGGTHYGKRSVENYVHRPRFELYDLDADPDEVQNLADHSEQAPLFAELQDKLKAFQERTDDPWLLKWTYE